MKKLDRQSWLATLGLSPPTSARDLGDMGTAFGLDASLTPTLPMPLDADTHEADPSAMPPPERG